MLSRRGGAYLRDNMVFVYYISEFYVFRLYTTSEHTYNIQMELSCCQGSNDFIGDVFELHHIHKCEVVVRQCGHNVLLKTTNGRKVASVLQ